MATMIWLAAVVTLSFVCRADSTVQKLSTANSDFALSLYKELAAHGVGENLFFSPASISTAMAMVHAGAKGNTKEEMADILKYGALGGDDNLNDAFKSLLDDLNSPSSAYNLSMANRLFGRLGYNFRPEFLKLTEEKFDASMEELDFQNNPDGATDHINEWVEEQTEDKIKDLIPDGAINSMTAMVLVNAIYFSGNWVNQFKEDQTQAAPFHLSKTETVDMDMMYIEKYFKMTTIGEWKCRMLELPYKESGEVSFFILLPDEVDGLGYLEERVNIAGIEKAITDARRSKIKVYLPKFKLTLEANMKNIFQAMGIMDLFKPGVADLSAMNGAQDLYVTEIVHKAFIDVNEKGTEAAAATGITVGLTSFTPEIKFEVNRPCLFFIRDKSSESTIFMGRLVKPPKDGAKIGAFGQTDDETSSANALFTTVLFSLACVLLSTIYTI